MIKKVVILGPESTGKSTLCELLAQHYKTDWCPEFARDYLMTHGTDYTFDNLQTIAKGQLALEEEHAAALKTKWAQVDKNIWVNSHSLLTTHHSPLLFIDTDMYVMKVWGEYVFEKCHQFILDQIVERKYDIIHYGFFHQDIRAIHLLSRADHYYREGRDHIFFQRSGRE